MTASLIRSFAWLFWVSIYTSNAAAYIVNANEFKWLEQHPVVRVGVVSQGLSWESEAPDQQAQGYAVELLDKIAYQAQIQLDYHIFPNQEFAIIALQNNQVDMLSSAPIHRRLTPFAHFSKATVNQPLALFNQLNDARISQLEQGVPIAVVSGSHAHEVLLAHYGHLRLSLYPDLDAAMQGLKQQHVNSILAGGDSVTSNLRHQPMLRLQHSLQLPYPQGHRFAVRDDWPELLSILNRGIAGFTHEQRQNSYEKWFDTQRNAEIEAEAEYSSYSLLLWTSSLLLLSLTILGLLLHYLRQSRQKSQALAEQLLYWKNHEEGTGLPNRRFLTRAISSWLDEAKPLSVFMFDFPRQAEVYENFGQQMGQLTKEAYASRVQKRLLRRYPNAIMGHWYNNFFVVAIPDVYRTLDVDELAQLIVQTCSGWLKLEHLHLLTRCHVGYSTYDPHQEVMSSETLLANTFVALNHAIKKKMNICPYAPEQSQAGLGKLTLESKLRRAIKNNELTLYLQPQFNLNNKELIGAEVLVRWFSEEGPISPAAFIPVAEDTGLVLQLDRWVYEHSMQMLARIGSRLPKDFKLSVNFSASTVALGNAEKIAISYAKQWQVNPRKVCIEITESAMLEQPEEAQASIQRLRDEGFGIAIDDFGTGYSSMAYLKHLPVTLLKIDREFVKGMEDTLADQHIVKAMVTIAKSLNYNVLIEGIETSAQANLAQVLGCESAQGFLFSHPISEQEFIQRYLGDVSPANLRLVSA